MGDMGREGTEAGEEVVVTEPRASGGDVHEEIQPPREEARRPKPLRQPRTPTQAEKDEHLPLHLEYREWCPDCVAGRATGIQHRAKKQGEEKIGITVSMDYCFMNRKATKHTGEVAPEAQEEEDEEYLPMRVQAATKYEALNCMSVQNKGTQQAWVAKRAAQLIDRMCEKKAVFQVDQEPAIIALAREVARNRRPDAESPMMHPKKGEFQSNGPVERYVGIAED